MFIRYNSRFALALSISCSGQVNVIYDIYKCSLKNETFAIRDTLFLIIRLLKDFSGVKSVHTEFWLVGEASLKVYLHNG